MTMIGPRAVDRMRNKRIPLAGVVAILCVTLTIVAAQDAAPPGFRPEEISIGEPLALPFGGQNGSPPAVPPSAMSSAPSRTASGSEIGLPGSGWLGLSLEESSVPGRWRIDEVVPGGPAARAGIQPGDELRAINGLPLAGGEEVSAAMTAIASGQNVRVAIARHDDIQELVLEADPRPPVAATRAQPPSVAQTPPSFDAASPSFDAASPSFDAASPSFDAAPEPMAAPVTPAAEMPAASRFGAAPPVYATPPEASPAAAGEAWGGSRRDDRRLDAPSPVSVGSVSTGGRIALGVRTLPIDSATQSRFNLSEPAGAYVFGVVEDLPASRAGVPPGSVIVALDGRPVRSPGELTQLVSAGPLDRPVTLQFVLPGGESRRASVELQSLTAPVVEALAGPRAATTIPALEPGPRRAERPETGSQADENQAASIRQEIRLLRQRLERLERRLESVEPLLRR